jgi:hypothetical protein
VFKIMLMVITMESSSARRIASPCPVIGRSACRLLYGAVMINDELEMIWKGADVA